VAAFGESARRKRLAKAAKSAASAPVSDIQKVLDAARGGATTADAAAGSSVSHGAAVIVASVTLVAGFAGASAWNHVTTSRGETEATLLAPRVVFTADAATEDAVREAAAACDSLDRALSTLGEWMELIEGRGRIAHALAADPHYTRYLVLLEEDPRERIGAELALKRGMVGRLVVTVDHGRVVSARRVRRDAAEILTWARDESRRCSELVERIGALVAEADGHTEVLPPMTARERTYLERRHRDGNGAGGTAPGR
jgi:hypothetical protein